MSRSSWSRKTGSRCSHKSSKCKNKQMDRTRDSLAQNHNPTSQQESQFWVLKVSPRLQKPWVCDRQWQVLQQGAKRWRHRLRGPVKIFHSKWRAHSSSRICYSQRSPKTARRQTIKVSAWRLSKPTTWPIRYSPKWTKLMREATPQQK